MDVVNALKNIATSASDDVLQRIAEHDRHEDANGTKKHFDALKYLIRQRDCELDWDSMSWYPHEAIALAGFNERDVDAFAVSIALLLTFDLMAADDSEAMESMLGKLSGGSISQYKQLPDRYRGPILAGVELLRSRWPDEFH